MWILTGDYTSLLWSSNAACSSSPKLRLLVPRATGGPVEFKPNSSTWNHGPLRECSKCKLVYSWGLQYLRFCSRLLIEQDVSERKLWDLHHTYGASLRSLFLFVNDLDRHDEEVNSELETLSPPGLVGLLGQPLLDRFHGLRFRSLDCPFHCLDSSRNGSSLFLHIYPHVSYLCRSVRRRFCALQ